MAKGKVDGWREGRLSAHVTKPHLHDNSINTYGTFGNSPQAPLAASSWIRGIDLCDVVRTMFRQACADCFDACLHNVTFNKAQ